MNETGHVTAKQKKKSKATTDSRHNLPVAPNFLERKFKVYVSDLTYLWAHAGWLYLVVVIDLFSRQCAGWSLNSRMTQEVVMNALRRPTGGESRQQAYYSIRG